MIYDVDPSRRRSRRINGEVKTKGEVCLDDDEIGPMGFRTLPNHQEQAVGCQSGETFQRQRDLGMVGADRKVVSEMSVKRNA